MPPLGDRRSWARFEVVGALTGSLEVTAHAPIVNINRFGMLVNTPVAPPVDSRLILKLMLGKEQVTVDARVRHSRPMSADDGSGYFVGFEFLSSSPSLESAIDRVVAAEAT
jgi:PilZ domain-containing protein